MCHSPYEQAKYDGRDHVHMGKAECEWVNFEQSWLKKLPELGWIEVEELERFTAKGIEGEPEGIRYKITATDLGWDIRDAYWARLNKAVEADLDA